MNFLADESVDGPVIARLRIDGHAIASIAERGEDLKGAFSALTTFALDATHVCKIFPVFRLTGGQRSKTSQITRTFPA